MTTSRTAEAHTPAELDQLARQLERAQALEAEFRAFADSARDYAFITLALDKTVVGWNRGAELLLGYSLEEIVGRPGAIFFTPEDVARGGPEQELSQRYAMAVQKTNAGTCGRTEQNFGEAVSSHPFPMPRAKFGDMQR